MRKYKVLVPLLVLKGNNLAEHGSEVDEASLLSPAIDLVKSNHIVELVSNPKEPKTKNGSDAGDAASDIPSIDLVNKVDIPATEPIGTSKVEKDSKKPKESKEPKMDLGALDDMLKK